MQWRPCRFCEKDVAYRSSRWITKDGRALCDEAPRQVIDGKDFLGYHAPDDSDLPEIFAELRKIEADLRRM